MARLRSNRPRRPSRRLLGASLRDDDASLLFLCWRTIRRRRAYALGGQNGRTLIERKKCRWNDNSEPYPGLASRVIGSCARRHIGEHFVGKRSGRDSQSVDGSFWAGPSALRPPSKPARCRSGNFAPPREVLRPSEIRRETSREGWRPQSVATNRATIGVERHRWHATFGVIRSLPSSLSVHS